VEGGDGRLSHIIPPRLQTRLHVLHAESELLHTFCDAYDHSEDEWFRQAYRVGEFLQVVDAAAQEMQHKKEVRRA
jgi:hypothetical protein